MKMKKLNYLILPTLQSKAINLIHKAYNILSKTSSIKLATTKNKGNVRGGGRKPWKQKGTGNARAGSIRSPLWRGGGIVFGPHTRLVTLKLNKKERKITLFLSFIQKCKHFSYFNQLDFNQTNLIKTENIYISYFLIINFFKNHYIICMNNYKILFYKLFNNLKLNVILLNYLTIKHIILSKKLIFTKYNYLVNIRFFKELNII